MGLDMYLEKLPRNKTTEQLDAESDEAWKKGIDYWREHIRDVRRVAYWRKVNWLHGYIVRTFAGGVDDCQDIELKRVDVELVLATCKKAADILSGKRLIPQKKVGVKGFRTLYADDPDKEHVEIEASDGRLTDPEGFEDRLSEGRWKVEPSAWTQLDAVLPPVEGFFFGSHEYDSYYVWAIFDAIRIFDGVLSGWDDNYRYVYRASW